MIAIMAISRKVTRVSIAQARDRLTVLIRQAEAGGVAELTRRGEPVAVLLSTARYRALTEKPSGFRVSYEAFRKRLASEKLDLGDDAFEGLRDGSPGRRVRL